MPAAAGAVERAYVDPLTRVTAWREGNEELALLDPDGAEVLRYGAATPVGSWQATGVLQDDGFTSLLGGTEITASFEEDGFWSF